MKSRLQQLQAELAARLEVGSGHREALRGQINRIRETIDRVLNSDTTLAERIKTLFREQGITIVSLLTPLDFIISTIVLSITNLFGGTPRKPTPTPKPEPRSVNEWIKTNSRRWANG